MRPTLIAALVAALPLAARAEGEPDWLPSALTFPEDAEIGTERAVGSSIRMISFTTATEGHEIVAAMTESLRASGAVIEHESQDGEAMTFSNREVLNGQVVLLLHPEGGRATIEIDLTLR